MERNLFQSIKFCPSNIRFVRVDENNREEMREQLNAYYAIRTKVFHDPKKPDSLYKKPEATEYDLDPSTVFFLAKDMDTDQIVGGCELLFNHLESGKKLKFETAYPDAQVTKLVPDYLTSKGKLFYGELAGVAVDPNYERKGIAFALQQRAFQLVRSKNVTAVVAVVTPLNITSCLQALRD